MHAAKDLAGRVSLPHGGNGEGIIVGESVEEARSRYYKTVDG